MYYSVRASVVLTDSIFIAHAKFVLKVMAN